MAVKPLVNPSDLLAGESLLSLLYRLSDENAYDDPRGVLISYLRSDLSERGIHDRLACPRLAETYETLSQYSGLPARRLADATAHRFSSLLNYPGQDVETLEFDAGLPYVLLGRSKASKHTYNPLNTQYCPGCLKEGAYHRIGWSPLAVTGCLQHRCLLVKQCPHCHAKTGVRAITYNECRSCGYRLSLGSSSPIELDDFDFFAQQVIQSWFGLCEPSAALEYGPLPAASPGGSYHFVFKLQSLIQGKHIEGYAQQTVGGHPQRIPDSISKTETSHLVIHALFTLAVKVLTHWPKEYQRFLEAYRRHPDNIYPGGLAEDFGEIYRWLQANRKQPEFEFAQNAFDHYVTHNLGKCFKIRRCARYWNNPDIADKFRFLTYREASDVLKIPATSLTILAKSGRLNRCQSDDSTHLLFYRDEIMALDCQWRRKLSIKKVMQIFGVSHEVIVDLVKAGMLPAEDITAPVETWRINERHTELFLLSLSLHVRPNLCAQTDLVDLARAIRIARAYGGDVSSICQRVVRDVIWAYCPHEEPVKLGKLLFSLVDIRACFKTYKQPTRMMREDEVARELGVQRKTLWMWKKLGLITPIAIFGNVAMYDAERIEKFARDTLCDRDAAVEFHIGLSMIYDWVDHKKLSPVATHSTSDKAYYLFHRADIQKLSESIPRMAPDFGLEEF